jgi:hypothetical protein
MLTALPGVEKLIEGKEEAITERLSSLGAQYNDSHADLNKVIAEFHGIGVMDFINSPNMALLQSAYTEHKLLWAIDVLKDEFGLSNKQAWAMIMMGLGLLETMD